MTRQKARLFRLVSVGGLLFMTACMVPQDFDGAVTTSRGCTTEACSPLPAFASLDTVALKKAHVGSTALLEGRYALANRNFNEALKLDPENPNLHFLNAVAYHFGWRAGKQTSPELAAAGYLLALEIDPGMAVAAKQLGMLYIEMKRYDEATAAFTKAVELEPDDADAYYALTASAYFAHDPVLAAWAGRKANALRPGDPEILRAAALASAAAGDVSEATRLQSDVIKIFPAIEGVLDRRIAQWGSAHRNLIANPVGPGQDRRQAQSDLVQNDASPDDEPDEELDDSESFSQGAGPLLGTSPSPPFSGAFPGTPAANPDEGPMQRNWSDCNQAIAAGTRSGGGFRGGGGPSIAAKEGSGSGIKELAALPSPCKGLPLPRMAMVDITILRTADANISSHGINLLDGLKVVLTGSRTFKSSTNVYVGTEKTRTNTLALPSGGLTYALNIANATEANSEIILRPTLIALDRTPSTFFTGYNVNIMVEGGGYSSGSLVEKKIGVTMAVTPTFIDDETMLMSVIADRTFTQPNMDTGTLASVLTTSTNSVSASVLMKFNQTLVLSGMRAQDNSNFESGVPVLKDIPGVQYLFGSRDVQKVHDEVVIVITPRRPQQLGDGALPAAGYLAPSGKYSVGETEILSARKSAVREMRGQVSNLDAIINALRTNAFYQEFRSGDISVTEVRKTFDLERTLNDAWYALLF